MPVFIPLVVYAAAAYVGASTIIATVLMTVASMSIAAHEKRKAERRARDAYNRSLQDRLVMVATSDAARSVVYGRTRVTGGVLFKGSRGNNLERFTMIVALAGHQIDAVEEIYFGDTLVSVDAGTGKVTTAPWGRVESVSRSRKVTATPGVPQTVDLGESWIAGSVKIQADLGPGAYRRNVVTNVVSSSGTSITFVPTDGAVTVTISWQAYEGKSSAAVGWYMGSATQDLSGPLAERFPGLITSEHKFRGIALLFVDFAYDPSAFQNGIPAVTAVIRGKHDIYDPRVGYVGYTDNPALCANDWAKYAYGGACADDEVDEDAVIAAANACDILHTYTDSAGVSTTRKKYTCSYVAPTDASPDIHMTELVECMAGKWGWAGGRLKMRAGVYSAPVVSIDDDWLAPGQRQINPGPGNADLVNVMIPTISDSAQKYVATPIAPVRSQAYIDADGMELPMETTMGAVSFAPQAQHICAVQMREMRQGMTLNWPVNMRAFAVELFDTVAITSPRYGFDGKAFEVVGWGFTLEGGIGLTLRETGASIYQPDDIFPANDPEPNTALPASWEVPTITGLAADSGTSQLLVQGDGTIVSRVLVTFDAINDASVLEDGEIEVQYSTDGDIWGSQVFEGHLTSVYLLDLQDWAVYFIKARARNKLVRGDWSVQVVHLVQGKAAQPVDVSSFAASSTTGGVLLAWAKDSELDFSHTQLRLGSSWSTATVLAERVTDSKWLWVWPADGTYTILARHFDRTGNSSATTSSATITVAGESIAVATSQIKDNAATKVVQTSLESGNTDALSATPTVTEPVQAGWTVLVTINFLWSATNPYTTVGRVRGVLRPEVSVTGGAVTPVGDATNFEFNSQDLAQYQDASGFGAKTFQYLVTTGGTLSVYARCSQRLISGRTTVPADIAALKVVVEVIKK